MITLSHLVERYQPELERLHGQQLLPSHRQALRAMRRCRRQASEQMLLGCKPCGLADRQISCKTVLRQPKQESAQALEEDQFV